MKILFFDSPAKSLSHQQTCKAHRGILMMGFTLSALVKVHICSGLISAKEKEVR